MNLFERTSSAWVRDREYEWKKAEDGTLYLIPAPNARTSIYDPLKEMQEIMLDALQIGACVNSAKSSIMSIRTVQRKIT
ncbi:hypothetical protein [Frisingicoccus sp.]|uniref:hypothetical protein n=1 Tax=Frisingicoccus sp. TaxID=1918627 RepID=UPI003AB39BE0